LEELVENALKPYCDIALFGENEVIYKSRYSRNRKKNPIKEDRLRNMPARENIAEECRNLAMKLKFAGFGWKNLLKDERRKGEQHHEHVDLIELHKTAIALALAVTETEFDISALDFVGNETVAAFMKMQGGNLVLKGRSLEMFSQSILFAELRGCAALMSRKEFITRSAIQTQNGGQAELLYIPCELPPEKITTPKGMDRAFLFRRPKEFIASLDIKSLSEKETEKLKQMRYYPHYFGYELALGGQGLDGVSAESAVRFEKLSAKKREIKSYGRPLL
jgi:hypothetical protein